MAGTARVTLGMAVILLGAAVAGFIQGMSGFAFGLVAMAFWSWVLEPAVAGPLVVFCSIIGQGMGMRTLRLSAVPRAIPFILGGLVGVPLGVVVLPLVNPQIFQAGLGVLLLVWCPAMLLATKLPRVAGGGRLADGVAGALGGIMGGIGGLPGPIPTLWCVLRGWDRATQRSVFQLVFLTMHVTTMTGYLVTGTITAEAAWLFPVMVPIVIASALLGARAYQRLGEIGFQRIVLGLLAVSGAILLLASVPKLLAGA
ncbi:MAG: putative rane transporter protein [Belnapia sp.]|nr:putative rane transporter protein [Belnapia sp.]